MDRSFSALIDRFGIGAFAAAIGVSYGAAKQMKRRNSVAPEYWAAVISASSARGWGEISAEWLMQAAAAQPKTNVNTLVETEAAA